MNQETGIEPNPEKETRSRLTREDFIQLLGGIIICSAFVGNAIKSGNDRNEESGKKTASYIDEKMNAHLRQNPVTLENTLDKKYEPLIQFLMPIFGSNLTSDIVLVDNILSQPQGVSIWLPSNDVGTHVEHQSDFQHVTPHIFIERRQESPEEMRNDHRVLPSREYIINADEHRTITHEYIHHLLNEGFLSPEDLESIRNNLLDTIKERNEIKQKFGIEVSPLSQIGNYIGGKEITPASFNYYMRLNNQRLNDLESKNLERISLNNLIYNNDFNEHVTVSLTQFLMLMQRGDIMDILKEKTHM